MPQISISPRSTLNSDLLNSRNEHSLGHWRLSRISSVVLGNLGVFSHGLYCVFVCTGGKREQLAEDPEGTDETGWVNCPGPKGGVIYWTR